MLRQEDRARFASMQDWIIELAVQQDEAAGRSDRTRAVELQSEIARLNKECDRLRRGRER
jgi:hypothetical protein